VAVSAGCCPRCSATVETTRRVCEDHDASDGLCSTYGGLHGIRLTVDEDLDVVDTVRESA